MKQVVTLVVCAMTGAALSANAEPTSRQCLVVTTQSWKTTEGTMSVFERHSIVKDWRQRASTIPVVVGKAGMAWRWSEGHWTYAGGHLDATKAEGDHKAPAGVFGLGHVFGYAPRADTKMPYLPLTPTTLGIDDPQSRYYNQIIDTSKVTSRDWRTAEVMRRGDDLYKWGIVVNHNLASKPGAGSCIFLHIWRGPGQATVGCTAMAEKNLVDLIHWLDPKKNPVLVQLPRPVYEQYRQQWNLPPLP